MERFDISAEFRRRVTSRGENQNGYDISSGKAEGRVFHAINLTLHFSLVLLHHFATFKSPPSLSLVFLLFQRLLHSFQFVSLRATPYYLSYVNEFRLIIQQDGVRKGKKRGMRVPFGTHGTERRDIAASVTRPPLEFRLRDYSSSLSSVYDFFCLSNPFFPLLHEC